MHVNMAPLTAMDHRIENGWTVDKVIVELPANNALFHMRRSSAHGIASEDQEHWPSKTSSEQWVTITQQLINGAIDQWSTRNSRYWSFIPRTDSDTLSVVSDNSVTSACCQLYVCQDFALNYRRYWCFWRVQWFTVWNNRIKKRWQKGDAPNVTEFQLGEHFWAEARPPAKRSIRFLSLSKDRRRWNAASVESESARSS